MPFRSNLRRPRRTPSSPRATQPRTRLLLLARTHTCARVSIAAGLLAAGLVLLAAPSLDHRAPSLVDPAAAAQAPTESIPGTVPAVGRRWFLLGAGLPHVARGCDFGCGRGNGVRARSDATSALLRSLSRRGVRVMRWHLFAGNAWQVRRGADGTPTVIAPSALRDLDEAVRLARLHDVYLLPVLLPDPSRVPSTWFTEPSQRRALAKAARPMFARYRRSPHVLGWELVTGAEALQDAGVATREQLRAHAAALVAEQHEAAPARLAVIAPGDVSRLDSWVGLGADLYAPHDPAGLPVDRCACRSASALAADEGLDRPMIVGAYQARSIAGARAAIERYDRLGYAGALAWSTRAVPYPGTSAPSRFHDEATWRHHYARPASGPRRRPLNPCYGPARDTYRCPNLRMSPPSSIRLGRVRDRSILYSTNSLDSRGAGPASLRGRRTGRFTMSAHQLLHRRSGPPARIRTGARLLFKAIPGQYRYWKWDGAARMELWRLDSAGRPVSRARTGPKTVYCLRDLKRRFGHLPRSPRSAVYPGCSQRLDEQAVTLGTSVGWSDVYPATYYENWVDVTGLRGCFAYVHVADPTNVVYESNEDDNTSSAVVRLPFTGSNRGCPGARPVPGGGDAGGY